MIASLSRVHVPYWDEKRWCPALLLTIAACAGVPWSVFSVGRCLGPSGGGLEPEYRSQSGAVAAAAAGDSHGYWLLTIMILHYLGFLKDGDKQLVLSSKEQTQLKRGFLVFHLKANCRLILSEQLPTTSITCSNNIYHRGVFCFLLDFSILN